jgi:gamma-glutamylcyclotransferase (GGCT)/AIG2-like uncharacterized protein YtfP
VPGDSASDEPCALFVYGTLKRGELNEGLLRPHAESVEPATARGLLYDLGLYPALGRGEGRVRGELVRLRAADLPAVLRLLDRLEGYTPENEAGSMYVRRVVEVETEAGSPERAYTYLYNRDLSEVSPIESGEWPSPSADAAPPADPERAAFERHVREFRPDSDGQ